MGRDTEAVLQEMGYSREQIEELKASKAIKKTEGISLRFSFLIKTADK